MGSGSSFINFGYVQHSTPKATVLNKVKRKMKNGDEEICKLGKLKFLFENIVIEGQPVLARIRNGVFVLVLKVSTKDFLHLPVKTNVAKRKLR